MHPRDPSLTPDFEAFADQFDFLLQVALRKIGRHEDDPQAYLNWARKSLPTLASDLFKPLAKEETDQAAYWMGVAIWNATPLESNRFRPSPLPPVSRNARCPCGSGRKFKQCCIETEHLLNLDTLTVWPNLASLYTDKYWLEQASRGVLPVEGMISVALYFHENQKFRPLLKLVEPVFGDERSKLNDQFAILIDPLCDAYDALYKTDGKKRALLSRLVNHSSRTIRSDANLRLATWLHDSGDIDGAWGAFQNAIRADPDNPSAAILEITLLCANGERDLAGQRAEFWLRRLGSGPNINPETLSLLERACEDPCGWYEEYSASMIPPELSALTDWISGNKDRPLPAYRWQRVPVEPDDILMRGAHELATPRDIRQVEDQWEEVRPLDKPFSTGWLPMDPEFDWDEPEGWLSFLQGTPGGLDSFDVIDDLLTLLIAAEALAYELTDKHAVQPLLARSIRMLEISQPPVEEAATLPWLISDNRPALRTLARAISLSDEGVSAAGRKRLINWYLAINPNDNHGFRTMAVDDLLIEGNDQAALDLIARYPDDHQHAELLYGGVLALYRLNRRGEALTRLLKAGEKLPLVFEYLLKEKVRKPRLQEGRIAIGGKDQAWLYRESMRDTWLNTEGMAEWLRGASGHIRRK